MAYFDSLKLDLYPLVPRPSLPIKRLYWERSNGTLEFTWNSVPNTRYIIELSSDLEKWTSQPFGLTAKDVETTRSIRINAAAPKFLRILAP